MGLLEDLLRDERLVHALNDDPPVAAVPLGSLALLDAGPPVSGDAMNLALGGLVVAEGAAVGGVGEDEFDLPMVPPAGRRGDLATPSSLSAMVM
jgi:hypothetical protein